MILKWFSLGEAAGFVRLMLGLRLSKNPGCRIFYDSGCYKGFCFYLN